MSAVLWPTVGRIVASLNTANGTQPSETAMRLLKVTEEAGEASAAYIGMTGQNPRKGTTHAPADVADELCDVIIAAAVALHSFTATPPAVLDAKLHAAARRLNAAADTMAPAAYRLAPPIADEIGWITERANNPHADLGTDYYVRKAAALDRIALQDPGDAQAVEEADAYAWYLIDGNPDWLTPYVELPAPTGDPRIVIRHAYYAWLRADLTARGRCPNCGWLDYQCNCADHPNANLDYTPTNPPF